MISLFAVNMPKETDGPLLQTLHGALVGRGGKVKEFEAELARFIGNPRVVTVMASHVHGRNDRFTTFREFRRPDLPGVDEFVDRMVCLPVHSHLSDLQIETVVETCNSFADARVPAC